MRKEDTSPQQAQTYRDIRAGYADAIMRSDQESERMHPGDVVFRDQARSEVERRVNVIAKAQQGLQNQAFGKAVEILSGRNGGEPPTTWEAFYAAPGARDLVALWDAKQYETVAAVIERNARKNEDRPTRVNADLVNSGYSKIVNGEITDPSQIYSMMADGLNAHGADYLVKKFEESQKPGGLKFGHMVDQAGKTAMRMLNNDFTLLGKKEQIPVAVRAFMNELDSRIKKEEEKGGNPRSLVDPTSKDNMLRPEVLKQFMPSTATNLQAAAQDALVKARATPNASGTIGVANAPTVRTATNPATGETLVSKDGGKTWQKP